MPVLNYLLVQVIVVSIFYSFVFHGSKAKQFISVNLQLILFCQYCCLLFHYRGKFKTNWMHSYLIFYVKYCTFNVVSRLYLAGVHIEYKAVCNSYTYCFKAVVFIILEKSFTCFLESSYSWIISAHLFRRQNFAILKYKREICLN